jgi:hypothetical protein
MNDVTTKLLEKTTVDLIIIIGAVVGAVVIIILMAILFFHYARVKKIGLSGIECDPEEEKHVVRRTKRRVR